MIIVDTLSKRYGKKSAVNNLSFTVPDGQVTGFLGANGSGKSTTMRCILGLDNPTGGRVTFSGTTGGAAYSAAFPAIPVKPSVAGAVLDASWFTPSRSGRNHLRVLASGANIPTRRVDECLELVGLSSAGRKAVKGYSLGMKQRLGLAAALLGDPQHLILDEPVNGLDPDGVRWMRDAIRTFADEGRAVLVSSHLLSEMEQIAHRLVVIGRGALLGEYTLEEFLANGTTIQVECREAVLLAEDLKRRGLTCTIQQPNQVHVAVPTNTGVEELRQTIAQVAARQGFLVTALATHRDTLENRFLQATEASREYIAR
ncbi:ABC transporter ATP-binding protein [Corynebacterium heidelbergense]|uniref:ABC transporter ATP-binding protein n=1 Tax=Corynebacterium heidelbergense TaxID=2055947 RepID=A0A364VDU0_9CORY|nr:ABC transporter ATP-binding protein [Corynebacterium heidelbergense]RAV34815.1 ABC transporter ATP-binding protein [Corynebacterium heidelbergense]WCZ37208.1 putative ABC transporter ATP-binding protein YxlF [Corynebacterium heidelbergense]